MTDKNTSRFREQFNDHTIYIIGALAFATIGISLWLSSTGHPLSQFQTTGGSDYFNEPAHHAHALIFASILLSGVLYSSLNDPDQTLTGLLTASTIGIGLAYGIIIVTGTTGDVSRIYTALTSRPLFTATAGGLGLGYVALLHTKYDWVAVNTVALILAPPFIASQSTRPMPLLLGVLFITAALDYLAVHHSSTMENMVNSLTPFRLPLAFFAPTTARSLSEGVENGLSGIRILGLGDVMIPGIFVVALADKYATTSIPVITALLGYLVAYAIIVSDPFGEDAYAGLPFLNAGVFLGYLPTLLPF